MKLALNRMSGREQLLVLVTVVVLVGGAYGGLRFYPANKAINATNTSIAAMDKAIRTGAIPEEPMDDVEDLKLELEDIEAELVETRAAMGGVDNILSPPDTTEIRLAISELARTSLVRITANEEYRVVVPEPPEKQKAKGKQSGKAAEGQPRKRMGDAAKRRARNQAREARRAARGSAGAAGGRIANVSPQQTTELVRKMAVNGPMERPMQRLTMEGTYAGIMRFLSGLESLDKMVTVVYLQMAPAPRVPPPGYNQRITATMVLAL